MYYRALGPGGGGEIRGYLSSTFLALSSRDYRLFAGGQAISSSGVWMQKLAQAWLVLEVTDSGLMLGLTVALQQLPTLLLTSFGGALADRFDRRRLLLASNIAGLIPALALGLLVSFDVIHVWMVMAAALFQGVIDALEKPTRMTLVNDLVEPRLLTNAVMWNNIVQDVGRLVGPAVAGILIATAGVSAAFYANAASYLPIIVVLAMIRPAYLKERTAGWEGGLRHTLRYVRARPELGAALGLTAIVCMFGCNFLVLIPVLFRDDFGGSAEAVGFALTWMGIGGIVGGLAVAGRIRAGARAQIVSAGVLGFTLILLAISPTMALAQLVCVGLGALNVIYGAVSAAHIQLSADREMRGRMMGLFVIAVAGFGPIGGTLLGAVAQYSGGRAAVVFAAVAVLLACVAAARFQRRGSRRSIGENSKKLEVNA